tara:strand:+ start:195 stop:464 length:270 start_codon:yes stop_codon:yes gene_type:complete
MNLFEKYFNKILSENMSGDGGVFGSTSGAEGASFPAGRDFYAPGDARVPDILGGKMPGKKKKRKKRRKKKSKVKKETLNIQRRNLTRSL